MKMRIKKKKILWALITLVAVSIALTGCMGDVVDVTVVLKNDTEYELKWVVFNIPPSSGTYSPMKDIVTVANEPLKPNEEREVVISFVDTDFGNSGVALIGLEDDGSSDSLYDAAGEVVLERGTNRFKITHDGEKFFITAADDSGMSDTEPETSPVLNDEFTLTLFADFPGETLEKKTDPMPIENEPASPSLIAFYLADELSAWTGLDFTLNDVSFGENRITVDWSKDSTLIAGLGDREQKEEFFFFDAVSLNWFMMDSLAMTLKNNLDIMTVYYCSDGGSVTFPNPEDMASQGLPELPANQSYEGSTFFINHAGGRGDLIPMEKDQAEYIVKEATQAEAREIEEKDGKPDYVYMGEGEVGGYNAWFFDLSADYPGEYTVEYRFAVNELGELWGMDTFGDWSPLPVG